MSSPAELKAAIRERLRPRVQAMTDGERAEASERIRQRLSRQPYWRLARSILGFVPTRSEPDVWPALEAARAAGSQIYLPRFNPGADAYLPCRVDDLRADLRLGPHRILEPAPDCPPWDGMHLDLILVPGIGFSPSGGRLGRGKGYYDRLLAGTPGCKCGLAFDQQLISELPQEPHDVRLDFVITPSRSLTASAPESL